MLIMFPFSLLCSQLAEPSLSERHRLQLSRTRLLDALRLHNVLT